MADDSTTPGFLTFFPKRGDRLDVVIAESGHGLSRRAARRLLSDSRVLVNGRPVAVASRSVGPRDRITVVAADTPITILRRTNDWLAIDKPSGVATQAGREGRLPSAVELLTLALHREGEPSELFVVHRLDTGTSGVVVFARTKAIAASLSSIFAAPGAVRKRYLALVHGAILDPITIDDPIGRVAADRFKTVSDGKGKAARTTMEPLTGTDDFTLTEILLHSGRTHQIRVHLTSIGHPVAGDRKYGPGRPPFSRPMLHAASLTAAPFGTLEAALPSDFMDALAALGLSLPATLA